MVIEAEFMIKLYDSQLNRHNFFFGREMDCMGTASEIEQNASTLGVPATLFKVQQVIRLHADKEIYSGFVEMASPIQ